MTPEEHTAAIQSLQHDVSEIKAVLNNGLRSMVHDQRSELAAVKADIQLIRDVFNRAAKFGSLSALLRPQCLVKLQSFGLGWR